MTRRKRGRARSLTEVVDKLPARFREPTLTVETGVSDLRAYGLDLSNHLSTELGTSSPPTVQVMTALGIPPSVWYRALMTAPRHNPPPFVAQRPTQAAPTPSERTP